MTGREVFALLMGLVIGASAALAVAIAYGDAWVIR